MATDTNSVRLELITDPTKVPALCREVAAFVLWEQYDKTPSKREIDDVLKDMRSSLTFVAFDEHDQILATAGLVPSSESTSEGAITDVATRKEKRGQGLGRMMIRVVEDTARLKGITHLTLRSLAAAIGFYEHLGYTRVNTNQTDFEKTL